MEDFKAGDRVNHYAYGTGVALNEARILVHFDNPLSVDKTRYQEWVKAINLTKIKPKVKRWRWVLQNMPSHCPKNNQKTLWITPEHWTQEEIEQTAKKHKLEVIEKLDSTEKEFED